MRTSPRSRRAFGISVGCGVLAAGLSFFVVPRQASAAPPVFQDKTAEVKLEQAGSAACWADFDNDGWVDLCTGGAVWKNQAGQSFHRTNARVGAAVAADYDNDGFVDLFSWSDLRLFHNEGDMSFRQVELPELPPTNSRGACWADLNNDGFVDLFVGGYEDWNAGITWPFVVLLNEQGKSFRVARSESKYRARGVTACDFDEDGDSDIYVSNYRLQPNCLWLNDGTGKLSDVAGERNAVAASAGFAGGHSIGAAWGDFNNDGRIDLFAGNFAHVDGRGDQPKSRFLQNLGPDQSFHFQDRGPCGVHYQESYATPAAADFDNDGDLDLFFTTVYGTASFGRPNQPVLFQNHGAFAMVDVTNASGLNGLGPTYQAAWADYDRDGDLDLISNGKLFQNQGNDHHWLKVRLTGDGQTVNRSAIGAQVRIRLGDQTLVRQVEAGTGEGNQSELVLHFGLGTHAEPVALDILWPTGRTTELAEVAVDRVVESTFEPVP